MRYVDICFFFIYIFSFFLTFNSACLNCTCFSYAFCIFYLCFCPLFSCGLSNLWRCIRVLDLLYITAHASCSVDSFLSFPWLPHAGNSASGALLPSWVIKRHLMWTWGTLFGSPWEPHSKIMKKCVLTDVETNPSGKLFNDTQYGRDVVAEMQRQVSD